MTLEPGFTYHYLQALANIPIVVFNPRFAFCPKSLLFLSNVLAGKNMYIVLVQIPCH